MVLANELGLNKKSFVGDINRDLEVWNQPIYGFESEILADDLSPSVGAAPGTVREVHVKTRMDYVEELSPMWHSQLQQDIDSLGTRIYEYRLELDREGQILGGEWVSFDRPDFFWRESQGDFDGTWVGLKDLLHQSWTQVQYPEDPRIGER